MKYAALFVGVNESPRSKRLSYAESDAVRTMRLLTSNLAFGRTSNSTALLGTNATRYTVRAALADMRRQGPRCAIFFFSGHGNQRGIALADGLLSYDELAEMLKGIGAVRPIVIIDACHAGAAIRPFRVHIGGVEGLDDDLEPAWISAHESSLEGLRFYAAVASGQGTYEDPAIRAGRFSWCFRRALRLAPAQFFGKYAWVTELDAFVYAAQELLSRWPNDKPPLFFHPKGSGTPLPLVLAQSAHAVGTGTVESVTPAENAAISLAVQAHGRQFIPTLVRVRVFDVTGRLVGSASRTWHPQYAHARHCDSFSVPWLALQASNDVFTAATFGHPFGLVWEVALVDDFGRVLDSALLQYIHVAA